MDSPEKSEHSVLDSKDFFRQTLTQLYRVRNSWVNDLNKTPQESMNPFQFLDELPIELSDHSKRNEFLMYISSQVAKAGIPIDNHADAVTALMSITTIDGKLPTTHHVSQLRHIPFNIAIRQIHSMLVKMYAEPELIEKLQKAWFNIDEWSELNLSKHQIPEDVPILEITDFDAWVRGEIQNLIKRLSRAKVSNHLPILVDSLDKKDDEGLAVKYNLKPASIKTYRELEWQRVETDILLPNGLKKLSKWMDISSFKVDALRKAAEQGRLQAIFYNGKWYTTQEAIAKYERFSIDESFVIVHLECSADEEKLLQRSNNCHLLRNVDGRVVISRNDLVKFRNSYNNIGRPLPEYVDPHDRHLYGIVQRAVAAGEIEVTRRGRNIFVKEKVFQAYKRRHPTIFSS